MYILNFKNKEFEGEIAKKTINEEWRKWFSYMRISKIIVDWIFDNIHV